MQRLDGCHCPLLESDSARLPDSVLGPLAVSPHWDVTAREMRGIMVAEDVGLEDGKVARQIGRAHV